MTTKRETVMVAIIAFLLGVIACHTAVQQIRPAAAQTAPIAGQKFQQKCERLHGNNINEEEYSQSINDYLNLNAQSGWKLVSSNIAFGGFPYFCFIKEL
jgi:hypothetical protein